MRGEIESLGVVASFVFGLFLFTIACMVVNSWDYHEARHNRIQCAEYNADAQSNHFPDQDPIVTIDLDACHPHVP